MIGIAETYKEIDLQGQKISLINFNCEHCGQIINGYSFNLSVFLYGAAFLVGNESGYVGYYLPKLPEHHSDKRRRQENIWTEYEPVQRPQWQLFEPRPQVSFIRYLYSHPNRAVV